MLFFGADDDTKTDVVEQYIRDHGITKVFVVSPPRFVPSFAPSRITDPMHVDGRRGVYLAWPDHIEYRYYYKVVQHADPSTLIVLNEVLRSQHRTALNFNCLRTFLRKTPHQVIFQYLPIIAAIGDAMTLIDLDSRTRWWGREFDPEFVRELDVRGSVDPIEIVPVCVPVTEKTRVAYAAKKAALLADVRGDVDKDPHIIPRNLLGVSAKDKLGCVRPDRRYVGRNTKHRLPNLETYREAKGPGARVVFELPHNHIEMCDLLTVSRHHRLEVLVADTKADAWYLRRYQDWAEQVNNASAAILHG